MGCFRDSDALLCLLKTASPSKGTLLYRSLTGFLLLLFFLEFMVQFWLKMITFQWLLMLHLNWIFFFCLLKVQLWNTMSHATKCLKFSEDWLDCVSHARAGVTPMGLSLCFVSWVSCASWLWEMLQRCPWNTNREVGRQELWCYSFLHY